MPHFTNTSFPGFPPDVSIAKLNKLSLSKLLNNDDTESARLYSSCKSSGFFLLDLTYCEQGEVMLKQVEDLFDMAEKLYDMPLDEKNQYALRPGTAFG